MELELSCIDSPLNSNTNHNDSLAVHLDIKDWGFKFELLANVLAISNWRYKIRKQVGGVVWDKNSTSSESATIHFIQVQLRYSGQIESCQGDKELVSLRRT